MHRSLLPLMILGTLCLTLATSGCTQSYVGDACAKDTDCIGDLICEKGSCVVPPACVYDKECGSNALCLDSGACIDPPTQQAPGCYFDIECAAGLICRDDGVCDHPPQSETESDLSDGDIEKKEQTPSEEVETAKTDDEIIVGDAEPLPESGDEAVEDTEQQDVEPVSPDDFDGDGKLNSEDNCQWDYNPFQEDADRDGIGDLCDNCLNTANHDQTDYDKDGVGDACDVCPLINSTDQTDTDKDKIGDACDNCPNVANTDQANTDLDDLGNICDPTPDVADSCAVISCILVINDKCANYGLACKGEGFGPYTCTKDCAAESDCPAPYHCNAGKCACDAPDASACYDTCATSDDCPKSLSLCTTLFSSGTIATGACSDFCETHDDCPDAYLCAPNGLCHCGPVELCQDYSCRNTADCAAYGEGYVCQAVAGVGSVCSYSCNNAEPCLGSKSCINGYCACDPVPATCPTNECRTKDDCRDAQGYHDDAYCLVGSGGASGYCSVPCGGKNDDYCRNYFQSAKYSCSQVGSNQDYYCVCRN